MFFALFLLHDGCVLHVNTFTTVQNFKGYLFQKNCFNGFVKSYTWTANENGAGVTKTMTTSKTQTSGAARFRSVSWELRRMLMWWSYFMLNQTAEKKSGLTGIRVYFHLLQMKHFLRRHSISSLKRRRHLKRWRFKWKLREVYWVFHHSNGFYEIVRFLPVRNIQNNVVI